MVQLVKRAFLVNQTLIRGITLLNMYTELDVPLVRRLMWYILVHTVKNFLNTGKVITGGSVYCTYSSSCSSAISA